jgi:hypothetical protein
MPNVAAFINTILLFFLLYSHVWPSEPVTVSHQSYTFLYAEVTTTSGQYTPFGNNFTIPVPNPDFLRGGRLLHVFLGWALATWTFPDALASMVSFPGLNGAGDQFIAAIGQSVAARIGYHITRDPMWFLVYVASETRLLFSFAYILSESERSS